MTESDLITPYMFKKPRTYTCERCGRSYSTTTNEKIHLCDGCTDAIIDWINMHVDIKFNGIEFRRNW